MHAVTLITHEPIAAGMAGPAIRVTEMARALSSTLRVRVASPYPIQRDLGDVDGRQYAFGDPASLRAAIDGSDSIVIQGFTLEKFPFLAGMPTPIVADLYCPFQLENLEHRRHVEPDADARARAAAVDVQVLARQLRRGDFFVCASERQRDYWLGMLSAVGRVGSAAYERDQSLRSLIDVVPFGLGGRQPAGGERGFKGRIPGIAHDDRVIVWGGSVLDWHDALTPIRAMADVARRVPEARLVFPVGSHPSPELPRLSMLEQARELASSTGLLDRHVFFTDWMPYDVRADYLREADVGVSAHQIGLEARFAWRTRILDYIWTGLPVVCTEGDATAELVARHGLGLATPCGDVEAMTQAMLTFLLDAKAVAACRRRAAEIRPTLAWSRVVAPLRAFCERPVRDAGADVGTDADADEAARARRSMPRRLASRLGRLLRQ